MKKAIYSLFLASLVVSCTENLEDKAVREAKEYTEKYCPTPYVNRNKADNKKAIDANKDKLHKLQKEALDNNPGLKVYKDAHFTFRFVYYSAKNPKEILLDDVFKY